MTVNLPQFSIANYQCVLLNFTPPMAGNASALPAWTGVFDHFISTTFNPQYYFLGQSILGKAVSPDLHWDDCYTSLFWDVTNLRWVLEIIGEDPACSFNDFWFGVGSSVNPADPSGTYTYLFGDSATPATITIVTGIAPSFPLDDQTIAVPAQWNGSPQPSQVRVSNYSSVLAAFGACSACSASTIEPAWDGTLPVQFTSGNFTITWYPVGNNIGANTKPALSVAGRIINSVNAGSAFNLHLDFITGAYWSLRITCKIGGDLWLGRKAYGVDPTGTYKRVVSTQAATGPDCIHIESY